MSGNPPTAQFRNLPQIILGIPIQFKVYFLIKPRWDRWEAASMWHGSGVWPFCFEVQIRCVYRYIYTHMHTHTYLCTYLYAYMHVCVYPRRSKYPTMEGFWFQIPWTSCGPQIKGLRPISGVLLQALCHFIYRAHE